jgi:hypothetical protein
VSSPYSKRAELIQKALITLSYKYYQQYRYKLLSRLKGCGGGGGRMFRSRIFGLKSLLFIVTCVGKMVRRVIDISFIRTEQLCRNYIITLRVCTVLARTRPTVGSKLLSFPPSPFLQRKQFQFLIVPLKLIFSACSVKKS